MVKSDKKLKIYIVVSQTGTVLSRILKVITGAEYNHASLCLDNDLKCMYSFGRKNPYNPFLGGFVLESLNHGTFKRFSNTTAKIICLEIDEEKYNSIQKRIDYMVSNKGDFGYNYLGLFFAWFKIVIKSDKRYYCSEFIKDILAEQNIEGSEALRDIPQPVHFLELPNAEIVYCGKLRDYSPALN